MIEGAPMSEPEKDVLAASLIALAAEYAADPAKGRRAGYEPEQEVHTWRA